MNKLSTLTDFSDLVTLMLHNNIRNILKGDNEYRDISLDMSIHPRSSLNAFSMWK